MSTSPTSTTFVRIHIWEHHLFQESGKQFSFYSPGHVALEVHCGGAENRIIYISFWPPTHKCCAATDAHFHRYETDKDYEKKDSETFDVVINAEGISKIIAAFEKFKSNPYGWSALGSSFFRRSYESNCAGLSLYLLEKGGMQSGSGSSAKAIVAAASSLVILGGVSLYSYSRIRTLEKASEAFNRFLNGTSSLRLITSTLLNYFKDVESSLKDKVVTGESLILQETLQEAISAFSAVESTSTYYPDLKMISSEIMKQFRIAKSALAFPFALTAIGLFINQKIWLKTVTPSDLKKIVISKMHEQHSKSPNITKTEKAEVARSVSIVQADLPRINRPFVKVWIWKQKKSQHVAATYQHTAIETHIGGNNNKVTYMSFWPSHQDSKDCSKGNIPHFHEDKTIDDKLLGEASTQYFLFLNVQKIHATFEKLKKNPSSRSNLGWGIFQRAYALTASNISILLLDKGGAFSLLPDKKTQYYARILKTVSACGIALAGINFITGKRLPLVNQDTYLPAVIVNHMSSMACLTYANEIFNHISKYAPEFLKKLEQNEFLEFLYQTLPHFKTLDDLDLSDLTTFIEALASTKMELINISKYTFGISVGALSLHYLIKRFVTADYTYSDVELS